MMLLVEELDELDTFDCPFCDGDDECCSSLATLVGRAGVELPPRDRLTDAQLAAKLEELFAALAILGVGLRSTDHLSDRELYSRLVDDLLHDAGAGSELDLVGSGSHEETRTWLRYYADERERRGWLRRFPSYDMPPHEALPFDRDRTLPRGSAVH